MIYGTRYIIFSILFFFYVNICGAEFFAFEESGLLYIFLLSLRQYSPYCIFILHPTRKIWITRLMENIWNILYSKFLSKYYIWWYKTKINYKTRIGAGVIGGRGRKGKDRKYGKGRERLKVKRNRKCRKWEEDGW